MKKVFNTLSALLILQVAAYAQQPQNRTSATKIADVLAQQPAAEKDKFLAAMSQLENFTAADIASLLGQLKPQGGNNSAVEYAANSYAFYVMQAGKDAPRAEFSKGLTLALNQLQNKDNKGFVLQLLRVCAKNEAIPAIAPYLLDDYLADRAARALVSIQTPEATAALSKALTSSKSEATAVAITTALGSLQASADEAAIIKLLGTYSSEAYQRSALTALSKIGGKASLPVFEQALAKSNYAYDHLDAAGLSIDYAASLLKNRDSKTAESFLSNVYTQSVKSNNINNQIAALSILTDINPEKQKNVLLAAANSEHAAYRNTALQLLSSHGKGLDTKTLFGLLKKATPEAQETVLAYIAKNGKAKDLLALQALYAKDKKFSNAQTLKAIDKLSNGTAAPFLISQLGSADGATLATAKSLLLATKGNDVIPALTKALAKADDKTKVALLGLLATRGNTSSAAAVLPLLASNNAAVRAAAVQAAPTVASVDNLPAIFTALSSANEQETAVLQQAVINAIKSSSDQQAQIQKLAANISRSAAPSAAKYFPIFAGLGGKESLSAVRNYITADQPQLKAAAIQALSSWSNAEALPTLVDLSRVEKEGGNFANIFKGLIRQVTISSATNDQKTLLLKDAFALAQDDNQRKAVLGALQNTGTYQALIFAGEQLSKPTLKSSAANTAMNIALDNKEFYGTQVRAILTEVITTLSGSESSYLKEAVIKHLAEMPQKEGFVSLFNGKDLTGWKGLVADPIKRGKMDAKTLAAAQKKADEAMNKGWMVEDGVLKFNGKGDNIATIKQYGDFEMLVDWKLDKNGKEGDAGVYLRGTPQVQIWDISRTNVGAQVGSGGLYNNQKFATNPTEVADNALGEWNTFKIKMVGEKVTVFLNGKKVTDEVPLENYWDRNQSIFPTEQIELQAHGTTVYYRDIFLKEIARKEVFKLADHEKKDGFKVLFDGTNLDQWTASSGYGISDEGHLWVYPNAKFGGNLYTKEEFSNFVYRFDFKLTPGANNGIGVHAPLTGDAAYEGKEIQVLDDTAEIYKNLKPYQFHGSLYGVAQAKKGFLKPVGEWNSEEIRVEGTRIKVTLNGTVILDTDYASASKNGTLDGKSHPGLSRKSGHIAFLGHGSEVFFKNIRVKKLN